MKSKFGVVQSFICRSIGIVPLKIAVGYHDHIASLNGNLERAVSL